MEGAPCNTAASGRTDMFGRFKLSGWLVCLLLLGLVEAASFVGAAIVIATPAQAQFWGGGRPSGGGFFGGWFGGGGGNYRSPPRENRDNHEYREYREYESPAESAHAPPPRKVEVKPEQAMPTTNVVVMGDGMADWLAYGLEDAFADTPEVSILRKDKVFSGLLKYDPKSDLDWWHVARDILAQEKPSYIVMMLGVSDRQNIRERDLQKEAEKEAKEKEAKEAKEKEAKEQKAKEQKEKDAAKDKDQKDAGKDQKDGKEQKDAKDQKAQPAEQEKTADNVDSEAPAAEQQKQAEKPKRNPNGVVEFRSEQWEKIYIKRIDDTIAALKSKNVPVFWVGLPAIRGAKSTADTSYLNNLYRARAQKAGIIFIDVWDGFVDEEGKYTNYGPDYEGQQRRLRANDGVYFTKYGARKLAHYVEREVRRYMASRTVSLPSPTTAPTPGSSKPSERPVAGPVIPLALTPSNAGETLAGGGARPQGDPLALQVLVKGEPVNPQPGRADDFTWQGTQRPAAAAPANVNSKAAPTAPAQAAPAPASSSQAQPAASQSSAAVQPSAPAEQNAAPVPLTDGPAEQPAPAKPKPQRAEAKPKPAPAHPDAPRPPRDVPQQRGTSGGPFGIFR
jgi:uncharacterized protein